jgi:hypothetical protein
LVTQSQLPYGIFGCERGVNLQAMLILTVKGDRAYIISYNAAITMEQKGI